MKWSLKVAAISGTLLIASGATAVIRRASLATVVPTTIPIQGQLHDATGKPLAGRVLLVLRLYDSPQSSTPVFTEAVSVVVSEGRFSVQLGATTPLDVNLFNGPEGLFLGLQVESDAEMEPRIAFGSVPYALRAESANTATSAQTAGSATHAVSAVNATNAVTATSATTATTADGLSTAARNSLLSTVYVRWGRSDCPASNSLVYAGFAGSKHNDSSGSGVGSLCMTPTPTYAQFNDGDQNGALLYAMEYDTSGNGVNVLQAVHGYDVSCATCLASGVTTSLMVPGTTSCPAGFTLQYSGYLMAGHYLNYATGWMCVDAAPEAFGTQTFHRTGGRLLQTELECTTGLPCAPYVHQREITCAVCTK